MSAPTIADLAADPLLIDPGIAYTYVIPVQGETTLGYVPDANYTCGISGRVLTVTYIGALVATATTVPLGIFASNSDGTTSVTLNLRVTAYIQQVVDEVADEAQSTTSGSADIDFGATVGSQLRVGDVVKMFQIGGAPMPTPFVSGTAYYVVAVSGSTYQISATVGGSAIVATSSTAGNVSLFIGITVAGSDVLRIRDTSALSVGQRISLSLVTGFGNPTFPADVIAAAYVKTIVDGDHIKASLTNGGSAITFAQTFVVRATDGDIHLQYAQRLFPVITSAAGISVALNGAVSYTITDDLSAAEYMARGLPVGLTLAAGVIAGNVAVPGFYPIILEARKGINVSFRYLLLEVRDE